MAENHCLSFDEPVEAQISKVLNAYITELNTVHNGSKQDDYDGLSDRAGLSDDIAPEWEKLDETLIKSIAEPKSLEAFIGQNIPIVKAFSGAEFGKTKVTVQTEFAGLVQPSTTRWFELSYNQLDSLTNDSAVGLNDFLKTYKSLADTCPPFLNDEVKQFWFIGLLEWFNSLIEENERSKQGPPSPKFLVYEVLREAGIVPSLPGRAPLQKNDLEQIQLDLAEEAKSIFAEVKLYQEQCFVLSQISNLIEFKKTSPSLTPRLPYIETQTSIKDSTDPINSQIKESELIFTDANAPILMQGEPFKFMNRLVQYPSSFALFNLTTAQLSSLVPTIRLYRIETSPTTGKDIGSTEIKFDTNPAVPSYRGEESKLSSALDLFENKNKRGYGVGLQSFNFTFHGSDPFATKKAIQAKLSIFATSFGDLITQRKGYKFADLALRTGKTPEDLRKNLDIIDQQNLDKLNFRLKAVVGWAIPKEKVSSFEFSEIDAVRNSFVNLNLTPTTHEFNFDEAGGVVFSINYLAYIEDYFNQVKFNIFSDPKIEAIRNARKLFYEFLNTEGCDLETLDLIKEADAKILESEKKASFSSILKKLRKQEKLLSYNLSYRDVNKFLRTGKIDDSDKLTPKAFDDSSPKAIQAAYKNFNSENERSRVAQLTQEDNSITFFFISDLLAVIMESIDESLRESAEVQKQLNFPKMIESQGVYSAADASRVTAKLNIDKPAFDRYMNERGGKEYKLSLLKAKAQFEKLRIVLGPVEIKDPFVSDKTQFCSIGDIPISLNYFTEFLTKKMIGRQETYYPLTNFVKNLINEVIKNFLNNDGCFDFDIRQKLKLNSTVVTSYNLPQNGFVKGRGHEIDKGEFESGQVPLDDITYYIANNRITKGAPGFGAGNVFDLSETNMQPILHVSGPDRSPVNNPPIEREMNYYIFYAGRSYPTNLMTGDAAQDRSSGIFHYVLGKDRGLVKNITLDRTDMAGQKELRFEKEGFDGLTQLREVYNASVDCFLNVSALPGCYIYIDPRGFSPEADINYSQFGIGGYYMITRAEHSIAPGKADTKLVAKWVADTNGRIESQEGNESSIVERNPQIKNARKCIAKVRVPKPRVDPPSRSEYQEASHAGAPSRPEYTS